MQSSFPFDAPQNFDMPRHNLYAILIVALISIVCYQRQDKTLYGRYLSRVLTTIDRDSLEPVDTAKLFDGAMRGIVGELDEYSSYISSEEREEFETDLEQEFGGIGVMIRLEPAVASREEQALVVVAPPRFGTPAQRAGVQVRDRILKIDDRSTQGMTMKEVIRQMRGEVGEPITLLVQHLHAEQPSELRMTREIIQVPSVLGGHLRDDGAWGFQLPDDSRIAYVRLTNFGEKTTTELTDVLATLEHQPIEALLLDLRDNAGGLLEAAVEACDLFLPDDLEIVRIKGRQGKTQQVYRSTGDGRYRDWPLVVLVNKYSASASEIVAACLQDHGRAKIVGQRTWGKGTVQHVIRIQGGRSILKLTAASYWRPSGKNIHRMSQAGDEDAWGVSPLDENRIELTDQQMARGRRWRAEQAILAAPRDPGSDGRGPGPPEPPVSLLDDPQLHRAVELLREQLEVPAVLPAAA